MHGRPRKPTKEEDPAAAAAKSARLRELQSQLLDFHHNHIYTKEALLASSRLLEVNPEVYTAWNYRKLAFQHNLKDISDSEIIKSAVQDELRVVEMALRRNPKSYGAWYHRKWILGQKLVPANFDQEFRLLDMLLKADARNFHGWNYRRFVARLKDVSEEEELKFTMDMINTNFSNYSAWHNRSMILSKLLKKKAEGFIEKENILLEEFDLVRQALFTDPSDQSGWFYHLWLLDQTSISNNKPQLITSWPSNGSKVAICNNSRRQFEKFPIILYFNQEIDCMSSLVVKVNERMMLSENFAWKPVLMNNNSKISKAWMANLNFFNSFGEEFESLKDFEVEIRSDLFENLNFVVELNYLDKGKDEDLFDEPFLWNCPEKCDNFQEGPPDFIYLEDSVEKGSNWNLNTLSDEIALFKEMAKSEEDSKFVKLSLARLLIAYNSIKFKENSLIERDNYFEEALKLFNDLIKLDPPHKRYYEDEISLLLLNQLTSSKESMTKYCSKCDKFKLGCFEPQICVKITTMPLTQIGFVERLLWVQALDLSHNNLRSISGLEALQLLECLNLSHNQIKSFSSLHPLKKLKSLKVLDLSFNFIGAHSIDTTRYLYSSPLSHPFEMKEILEEVQKKNIRVEENWEAVLFFESMQLVQLELQENPIADEEFRVLVREVVPSLKWLDGHLIS